MKFEQTVVLTVVACPLVVYRPGGGGGRSADELSIGAGASDDEYRDEFALEADNASQEITKKSKSR